MAEGSIKHPRRVEIVIYDLRDGDIKIDLKTKNRTIDSITVLKDSLTFVPKLDEHGRIATLAAHLAAPIAIMLANNKDTINAVE